MTMQFSIYTRGKNVDYKWSPQPDLNFQEYLGGNGVNVARRIDGTFAVYFVSEPSDAADYQGRKIRVSVLVSGCTEAKARALAIWGLEHWDGYVNTFTEFVRNFGQDDWGINTAAVERWVNSIGEPPAVSEQFTDRYENGNTDESRKALAAELRQHTFSGKTGFKLAVDGGVMTGGNLTKLKETVDRCLSGSGTKQELKDAEAMKQPIVHSNKKTQNPLAGILAGITAMLLIIGIGGSTLFYVNVYLPLRNENWELKSENRKLEECKKYLKDEELIANLQQQKQNLEAKIPNLNGQVSDLDEMVTKQKNEYEELKKQHDQMQKERQYHNNMSERINNLEMEIQKKKEELASLQANIDTQKQAWLNKFTEWQNRIRDWQKQIQNWQKQISNSPPYQQIPQTLNGWHNTLNEWHTHIWNQKQQWLPGQKTSQPPPQQPTSNLPPTGQH